MRSYLVLTYKSWFVEGIRR